ncbi:MAG: hypothetical protein K0R14_2198 [Burkholderiales bacterium]|jgi:hypothetical protein|nr:hypothetical protein [Burkholderiales bacterium]
MKLTRSKVAFVLKIIAVFALLTGIIFSSFTKRGSSPILKKETDKIYTWKEASLRVKGPITPDKCALTTNKCKCILSEKSPECLFNFTFEGLNNNAKIVVKDLHPSNALNYDLSKECSLNAENKIMGCSITFKWAKSYPLSKELPILLTGTNGTQRLLIVEIGAAREAKVDPKTKF